MPPPIPPFIVEHYRIREWRHALAILAYEYPAEWADILDVLTRFRLRRSQILEPGGAKTSIAQWIDVELRRQGWKEKGFRTKIVIDDTSLDSPTHKVDCFKNRIGLEIEWNNKDPFFDRDLNNFRLLFDLRALSVGVIVTRTDELQAIFDTLGKGKSCGNSTTHWKKLIPRIEGGGGGGCPVAAFGISAKLYVED